MTEKKRSLLIGYQLLHLYKTGIQERYVRSDVKKHVRVNIKTSQLDFDDTG